MSKFQNRLILLYQGCRYRAFIKKLLPNLIHCIRSKAITPETQKTGFIYLKISKTHFCRNIAFEKFDINCISRNKISKCRNTQGEPLRSENVLSFLDSQKIRDSSTELKAFRKKSFLFSLSLTNLKKHAQEITDCLLSFYRVSIPRRARRTSKQAGDGISRRHI